ncbi:MAG: vitamin B12 dependent methionine synthase, activation domain protein [Oscillospiraceae bacterium]|nr:vitamin B12 dependent methionine synthase, activation domain protein [Oscillospiraceae bacterium]
MEARLTGIERNQVLQYLGYKGGGLSEALSADLARCERTLMETARPRAVWRLYPLLPDGRLEGTDFTPAGDSIRELLHGCDAVLLMAATLGSEVEQLIRRAQVGRMGDAVILDACGSAAIENVCDNLCADLEAAFVPRFLTDRFSPGYGDMPLKQQEELFRVLDVTRRIGVSLSESGLMLPQKSVTALIGVSDSPQPRRHRGCASCAMFESCAFRKDGTNCGAF